MLTRPLIGAVTRGEIEVQRGGADGGLGLLHRRDRVVLLLHALVQQLGRGEVARVQRGGAHDLLVGQVELGVRGQKLCLGLLELDLERARIDHEQQVALMDDLAVGEVDLGQVAADLGADLDIVHGRELAGEGRPGRQVAPQRGADGDGGRGWRSRGPEPPPHPAPIRRHAGRRRQQAAPKPRRRSRPGG